MSDIDLEVRLRIAAHLRQKMDELQVSQRQLAKLMGVSPASLSNFLSGFRPSVGLEFFIRAVKRLRLDPNRLLDVDPPKKYFEQPTEVPPYTPRGGRPRTRPRPDPKPTK
jgi:transcriptional regulator with XRE-family HTH domain